MTISVRNSRQFPPGPISLVALSKREKWPFPVSLRKLCAPEVSNYFNPWSVTSGDVSANGTFATFSRGGWSATANVHDSGTFGGDGFVLELTLNGTPGVGTSFRQSLDPNQTVKLSKSGWDPYIRDHFSELHAGTAHLSVTPNWGQATIGFIEYVLGSIQDGDPPDNGGSTEGGSTEGGSTDE